MFSSQPPRENGRPPSDETVTVMDEMGQTLQCSVEHSFDLDGQEYLLLMPIDTPVEIFSWVGEDQDDDEAHPVEDEAEIDKLFPIAKAVLEEQNLTLKRTAVVLTVEGDLPEWTPENEENDSDGAPEGEYEELQWIASFYNEEQEYGIYSPLDPFFVLARVNAAGEPELLSQEEFKEIEPMLPAIEGMIEDRLFEELDGE
ncbi:DUF3727 domain-containing protein [Ancylothrix sp. C2]|uniref:DUF3727 domain-containing protein n=1 Tax=Ancylothrix sp. D3o TaxID=2953691 RepID=UPI0021BAB2BC|nr:DUF3727 domain-containing protein [Ancylothrix sp. D3o]MCT7951834.1 DUF3727 domain-containing protein [Ancylothrix sp. D3o]